VRQAASPFFSCTQPSNAPTQPCTAFILFLTNAAPAFWIALSHAPTALRVDLTDGKGLDTFESTSTSVTYTAGAGDPGIDVVGVNALPPATDGATSDDAIGSDCTTVTVEEPAKTLHVVFEGHGQWNMTDPPNLTVTAPSVDWHAVYDLPIPDLTTLRNAIVPAGPGTTVTGTSTYDDGTTSCTGPLVVNTFHGEPNPPATPQTPQMILVGDDGTNVEVTIDTFGGYDYRVCDGHYNLLVGPFDPGMHNPGYAAGIAFVHLFFDPHEWAIAGPRTQELNVGGEDHGSQPGPYGPETADAAWTGTITLSTTE
jgi:hypothetical protein